MKILFASAVLAASFYAAGAHAADTWLACKGTMTVTPNGAKAPTSSEPSERVLSYDDDIKRIYQWLEPKKQLSPLPEKIYTDKEITWDVSDRTTAGSYWNGRLDRANMSLTMEYTEGDLTKTLWKEACAPTTPRTEAGPTMADAETGTTKAN